MGHAERFGEDFPEREDEDGQPRREQRDKDFANCGVEEVMAELQRQITEYVTENNITSWPDRREAAGMK